MLKDKEPRLALFCFAWNIFACLIYESQGLCQGEAGELAIAEISADGSQWCAKAICIQLCKQCFLHLPVGFKRFARQGEENCSWGCEQRGGREPSHHPGSGCASSWGSRRQAQFRDPQNQSCLLKCGLLEVFVIIFSYFSHQKR